MVIRHALLLDVPKVRSNEVAVTPQLQSNNLSRHLSFDSFPDGFPSHTCDRNLPGVPQCSGRKRKRKEKNLKSTNSKKAALNLKKASMVERVWSLRV
jgi:hypothetical protein